MVLFFFLFFLGGGDFGGGGGIVCVLFVLRQQAVHQSPTITKSVQFLFTFSLQSLS